jgi:methionine sulfoxide reductase heme-binding subunit
MFLVTDRTGRFSPLKATTLAILLAPFAWILYRAGAHDLGPLPVKEALHMAGDWALRFLIATLAMTPAQRIFNWPKLALIRRMAGVGTFCYAALHFVLYIAYSKFDVGFVASEIVYRFYLLIGFVALLGLSALAATSTDAMVRKLGAKWKKLHQLVYGISVLALLHAFIQYKLDATPAALMAGFFLLFMVYRFAIKRRVAWTPAVLAGCAALGAAAAAAAEFAWYRLATGVDPVRVLKANFVVMHGIRPAVWVLIAGLAVAAVYAIKKSAPRLASATSRSPAR